MPLTLDQETLRILAERIVADYAAAQEARDEAAAQGAVAYGVGWGVVYVNNMEQSQVIPQYRGISYGVDWEMENAPRQLSGKPWACNKPMGAEFISRIHWAKAHRLEAGLAVRTWEESRALFGKQVEAFAREMREEFSGTEEEETPISRMKEGVVCGKRVGPAG